MPKDGIKYLDTYEWAVYAAGKRKDPTAIRRCETIGSIGRNLIDN